MINPRLTATKLALGGNVIDLGIKGGLTAKQIPAALETSLIGPLKGDVDALVTAAERAPDPFVYRGQCWQG